MSILPNPPNIFLTAILFQISEPKNGTSSSLYLSWNATLEASAETASLNLFNTILTSVPRRMSPEDREKYYEKQDEVELRGQIRISDRRDSPEHETPAEREARHSRVTAIVQETQRRRKEQRTRKKHEEDREELERRLETANKNKRRFDQGYDWARKFRPFVLTFTFLFFESLEGVTFRLLQDPMTLMRGPTALPRRIVRWEVLAHPRLHMKERGVEIKLPEALITRLVVDVYTSQKVCRHRASTNLDLH